MRVVRGTVCVLSVACALAPSMLSGQTVPEDATSRPSPRDTVVLYRRDTVVVVRKDTVLYELVDPARRTRPQQERPAESALERRLALREERRREYQEWEESQPVRRPEGKTWAYKFYPSTMLRPDFPGLTVGVERTFNGTFGFETKLGLLTRPITGLAFNTFNEQDYGDARFGLRGVKLSVEGRLYMGKDYNAFPFYLGWEVGYALAPLEYGIWVSNNEGTYEQRVDAPVNAQDFNIGMVTGWQLRTPTGLAIDMSTGIRIGVKGLYSSNATIQESIGNRHWNLNDSGSLPYIGLINRIGIGYGKWQPTLNDNVKSKRKKKRRRR